MSRYATMSDEEIKIENETGKLLKRNIAHPSYSTTSVADKSYSRVQNNDNMKFPAAKFQLPIAGYVTFIVVILLFGVCTKFDDDTVLKLENNTNASNPAKTRRVLKSTAGHMMSSYGMLIDATAMCVMGFGFLYAFCKRYTWGGIALNFFICGLCFLWCQVCTCIVKSMFDGTFHKTEVNIVAMISADLVTAAVLITFGVIYGFVSPCQLIVICLIEPFAMKLNEHIVVDFLHVTDAGGSILTHAFGAFFGLGLTLGLGVKPAEIPAENRATNYMSDTFSLIGTVVLWMFWPSFNGSLLFDDEALQQRVVVNTYLAICASCVVGMVTSALVNNGKFSILEVQNATLAGGVSIGMSCSFNVAPWVPVLIGGLAGALSSVGYAKIAGALENIGVMDSAGATQLHGIPGVFGALAAGVVAIATTNNHLFSYNTQWVSTDDTSRSPGAQFGYILAAIICTFAISFIFGAINGLLVRVPLCDVVEKSMYINEAPYFQLSEGVVFAGATVKGEDYQVLSDTDNNRTEDMQ